MELKNINDNILTRRWKERYAGLSDEVKAKLKWLDDACDDDIRLQVIKRKRAYPTIGDIFELRTHDGLLLHGVVANHHVNNINGDDQLVIFIFKPDADVRECINSGKIEDSLLIPPRIVTNEYWTRGWFYTVDHCDGPPPVDYGFYSVGKGIIVDEYGNPLPGEPRLLHAFGVATYMGIAMTITKELIIAGWKV